jgi:beta-glucosidase
MDRRGFLLSAALGTAASQVSPRVLGALAPEPGPVPRATGPGFPADFQWGVATSAYQIEGAASEDGRGPSIWDTFSHTPGKVAGGATGDLACDHYHRYREDVALMADLGVKHYRFSLSWSRILPAGRGAVNEKGLDFYQRLVDELHKHGITPHATLFHWDLPQALQDRYRGWQSREITEDFSAYAALVARRLGDRVTHWMTLNEISSFCLLGHGAGSPGPHAPGLALPRERDRWQTVHHALLAHGLACQALRANAPGPCHVSMAEDFRAYIPVMETPEHITAARLAFTRCEVNGGIIVPLLTGRYDPFWLARLGPEAPRVQEGDLRIIQQPLDAVGLNCYNGRYVRAARNAAGFEVLPLFPGFPKMNMDWLAMTPEAICWAIRMVGEALGKPRLPVIITENGCADGSKADPEGNVLDTDRLMYLRAYLGQVQRAVAEGYPVAGYFPWSFLDNFEWAEGYGKRFGLVHVEFASQKRTPKLSGRWYQEVMRRGRVV